MAKGSGIAKIQNNQKKKARQNRFRFGSGSQTAAFGVVGGGGEKREKKHCTAQHSTAGFFLVSFSHYLVDENATSVARSVFVRRKHTRRSAAARPPLLSVYVLTGCGNKKYQPVCQCLVPRTCAVTLSVSEITFFPIKFLLLLFV